MNDTQERSGQGRGQVSGQVSAEDFLIQVAGIYKHEMSEAEAFLWKTRVCSLYPAPAIIAALISHMESGMSSANFMPQYGAIKAQLSLGSAQHDLHTLEKMVRTGSPYEDPQASSDTMRQIIFELGGWARVCAEFPDSVAQPGQYLAFAKRFEQAQRTAITHVEIFKLVPAPPHVRALECRT